MSGSAYEGGTLSIQVWRVSLDFWVRVISGAEIIYTSGPFASPLAAARAGLEACRSYLSLD